MKRTPTITIFAAAAIAACATFTASRSAAEPILGEDSLGISPDSSIEKQQPSDALALFKAHDYEGALKLWKETVAKKNPDLPPAQVIMFDLFSRANMPQEAQKALDQAAVDAPGDPEPYLLMAGLAMRDRDLAKAESLLQKVGGLLPGFSQSAKRKASLQFRLQGGLEALAEAQNNWAGAQKACEELLKLDPKNAAASQRMAYCMLKQKDVEGALAVLRNAAKANPAMLTPEALVAQYYQRADDLPNTKKWMKAALAAAPKDLRTRLTVGQCALELGLMEDAQRHAVAAMQIDPKSLEAEFFRGLVALCQRDYHTAQTYFESAMKNSPTANNMAITNNLALALIGQEDEASGRRALGYAEANTKQAPTLSSTQSTYGWVLYRQGKLDAAEKALRTAAKAGPLSVDTAYFTARVEIDRGRKAEARKILETALKTPGRAMFRSDAEDLLEELKK